MSDLTLTREDDGSDDDAQRVIDGLKAFNRAHAPQAEYSALRLFLRDPAGAVVGGLLGDVIFGWLFVRILWVSDEHRGGGHGARLMRAAEDEARARGCHGAWLDTFSFQAPAFYAAQGYLPFGRLDDYPPGHSCHFLWKPLVS